MSTRGLPRRARHRRAAAEGAAAAVEGVPRWPASRASTRAGLAHGEVRAVRDAAPARRAREATALQQPEQKIQRRGPPVTAAFDATGAAHARGHGLRAELRRDARRAGSRDRSEGQRVPELHRREGRRRGARRCCRLRRRSARCTADSEAHALGRGRSAVRAPRALARDAAGQRRWCRRSILGVDAGTDTRGHRFHRAGRAASRPRPPSYERALEMRGKVDRAISRRVANASAAVSTRLAAASTVARALIDDALLDEVTALVEWPVPLAGRFEERFLALPRELLISMLQDHQRYFPVEDAAGRLLPAFITVSNIESRDWPSCAPATSAWCGRVSPTPRSSGSRIASQPLAERLPALDAVTFQAQLGSIGDKVQRVDGAGARHRRAHRWRRRAGRARGRSSPSATSSRNLVGEFPELQGVMGRYYAAADGEPAEVAARSRSTTSRAARATRCRRRHIGLAVALADRLDTLTGIFAIGQKPSGTKDPFASAARGHRRAAHDRREAAAARSRGAHRQQRCARTRVRTRHRRARLAARAIVACEVYDYVMERLRASYLEADRGERTARRHHRALRCGARHAPAVAARLRCAAARGDRFLALAGGGEPHCRQQAHRQPPEESRRAASAGRPPSIRRCCASMRNVCCTKRCRGRCSRSGRASRRADYASALTALSHAASARSTPSSMT